MARTEAAVPAGAGVDEPAGLAAGAPVAAPLLGVIRRSATTVVSGRKPTMYNRPAAATPATMVQTIRNALTMTIPRLTLAERNRGRSASQKPERG